MANTRSDTSISSGSSSETEEVRNNLDIIKPVQSYVFNADRILFFTAFVRTRVSEQSARARQQGFSVQTNAHAGLRGICARIR